MNSRDLNILALPEPTKAVFQKRIDEIGVGLHRRFDALLPDKADQFDLANINHLLCLWDSSVNDFEKGFDMNFGSWQDEMESLYWEICEELDDLEETTKAKGGDSK